MTPTQFSTFLRMQGYRVIETEICCWYNYRPLVFMSVPYHRALLPSREQLARVLFGGPSLAVRFPTTLEKSSRQAGSFICTNRNYDLASLHKKARNQARRGLESCTVKQIDFAQLAQHGYELHADTYRRQGKDLQSLSLTKWHRFCEIAGKTSDFEAWGAWVGEHLAAVAVTALVEDSLHIYYQSSATEYLKFYPNNALTFLLTKQKISCSNITSVCYGVKSLTRPSLDDYKVGMGFEVMRFGERIVFNPLVQPILALGGTKIIRWIARRQPEGPWGRASLILEQCGR